MEYPVGPTTQTAAAWARRPRSGVDNFRPPARSAERAVARQELVSWSLSAVVSINSRGLDEHGRAALLAHDAVVGVPVVVGAARAGEHRPQQQAQALGVDAVRGVVGADQLARTLDADPQPPGSPQDGGG